MNKLEIEILPGRFAVCQLPKNATIPNLPSSPWFSNISITPFEISIVCEESAAPNEGKKELGWRCLKLNGIFAFNLTGILLSVLEPLAKEKIGVFAVSTFNTDYVLVKDENLANAIIALSAAGHSVRQPDSN